MEQETKSHELPDAFSLFGPSWKAFLHNFETFVWQLLLPTALVGLAVVFTLASFIVNQPLVYSLVVLFWLAVLCVSVVVMSSIIFTELASVRKQHLGFRHALHSVDGYIWRLVGLFIISGLAIGIGFILFIVPGLFMMQRLILAPYFMIDQNLSIRESLRQSWRAGKKFSGAMWSMVGIIVGINLVSWIPFIGWIFSMALTIMYLCAPAIRYIQIAKHQTSTPVET